MENSLKSGANKRRLGEKLWLVFVLANAVLFLVAVCISVFWPSELPKFVSSLTIVSGLALIYAYLIEWCLDALASKQSKSALEILERDNDKLREENNELQKELASVRAELEETRGRLYKAENELVQTQEWLYETENVLEQTRDWVCEAEDELVRTRDQLDETKDELTSVKSKLSEAQHAERCYESLRKAYSEATLDLLKTRSERDTARRIAKKFIAKCNKLRYKLVEARIGCEFFQGEYVKADARVARAKEQIVNLESAVEIRDSVIGSLLDDVVIRTKG